MGSYPHCCCISPNSCIFQKVPSISTFISLSSRRRIMHLARFFHVTYGTLFILVCCRSQIQGKKKKRRNPETYFTSVVGGGIGVEEEITDVSAQNTQPYYDSSLSSCLFFCDKSCSEINYSRSGCVVINPDQTTSFTRGMVPVSHL